MTEQHRTVALERDRERINEWLNRLVRKAFRKASEAARIVGEVQSWVAYERHLIDTCEHKPGCECVARAAMLDSLSPLLPETSERRADTCREVTPDGRHASDEGRRPGAVTPDP